MQSFLQKLTPPSLKAKKAGVAQPEPLFLMTGTYVEAFRAFGLQAMLEPVVLGSGFKAIETDIPRLTFLNLHSGNYLTFISEVLKIDPAEYMQGDIMGGALATIVSTKLCNQKVGEYCKRYNIDEDTLDCGKLIVKEHRFVFINDLGQLCAFVYTCTNAAPNGHWMISFIQNATAPQEDRIVQIISNLNPVDCGMPLTENSTRVTTLELDDLPAYLRSSLGSEDFYKLLGFNKAETSLINADGIANLSLLSSSKDNNKFTIPEEDKAKAQEKIDTHKEKTIFYFDEQPCSRELVAFLKARNFFPLPEKFKGTHIDVDGTFLTVSIEDNKRTLLYGDQPLAISVFEDERWKVTQVFTESFPDCRYYQGLTEKSSEMTGYIDELHRLTLEQPDDSLLQFKDLTNDFFKKKGFKGLHLVYITRESLPLLTQKIIDSAMAADPEELADSQSPLGSSSTSSDGEHGINGSEEEQHKKPALASSISFFSRRPTRIFAGIGGAAITATGGTSLALEFVLPSALAFLHLGVIAILAISAVLLAVGLAAMGFGITKGVQAYRASHAAAAA